MHQSAGTITSSVNPIVTSLLAEALTQTAILSPAGFQSSSYSRMVDNCIQVHRCTTDITGWLKGGHPTFKDGIVDRKACFHGWENCCYRIIRVQIRVRECQGFYVYELNPSPEGRYRYCARGWTVSGPSVWLEELWIVQKGFHVENVVRAKTTHVIINNDIAIRKWFILT